MQKILQITTLLFISLSTVYSQSFEPGYIVKEGKKIDGFIKYYDQLESPKFIEFKPSLEGVETKIGAENIAGFSVHGEEFISQSISISLSPSQPKLNEKPLDNIVEYGFFFIQVWFKTPDISLYEMVDSKKESHFFIEKEDKFQELFYTKYLVISGSNYYEQERKGYIGQLRILMADCETISISDDFIYTRNRLLELCKSYSACKGTIVSVQKKTKKDLINFSIGLTAGKILNQDNHFNWISGLVVRMNFSRHFRNQYIQLELSRLKIYDLRLQFYGNSEGLLNRSAFTIMGGSHFGSKNLRPFFNVGIIMPVVDGIGTDFDPILNSVLLGAGVSWKRSLKIEFRQNRSSLFRQVSLGYMYNF